jgi:hypothetical protein
MRRNSPAATLEREEHPILETFERVLNSGVIVDRSSGEDRRESIHPLSGPDRAKAPRDE